MTAYVNRVYCSESDVKRFMDRWPCSGLAGTRLWFEFDPRRGDLVDLGPGDTSDQDGPGLLALSQDAHDYLKRRRKRQKLSPIPTIPTSRT